jgi:predicted Zn-dependent protease
VRRIEFRSVAGDGVNAFALPGGIVVFLDGIVDFVDGDDEMLLAILAHEASHQAHHDMTRGLFQALGYVALAGLVWGDYSSVASNGAVLFGQLHHTRAAELRADVEAIESLRRAGVSPAALARFFWKENAEAKRKGQEGLEWLSTHPGSRDRAERAIEAADADRAGARAASAPR